MALLRAHGLTRRPFFEARDLEVARGEIVALAGPSGSGKTLFLRALADLDPVDEGTVELEGRPREDWAPTLWRARVLYVHQTGVRLCGTVRENLERVAALALHEERDGTVPPVPDLHDAADADRLSGGEAQALALHRALWLRPEVLLLDESTSALDPDRAAFWEGRVRAWVDEGHAAVWVAHDPNLPQRVGARRERFP